MKVQNKDRRIIFPPSIIGYWMVICFIYFSFMVLLLCFTHVTIIPRAKFVSEADSRSSNLFAMCSDISIVLKIAKIEFERALAELSQLTLCNLGIVLVFVIPTQMI